MRSKGFTLIEVILVMVLLGILASYVLIRFPDKHEFVLRGHSNLLLSHIRQSQKLAMARHQPLRLNFNSNLYCVTADLTRADCTNPIIDPTTGSSFQKNLSSDMSLSVASLVFDSLGRPVSAGVLRRTSTSISLSMGAGSDTITVQAISGFAEIL
ncbi:MAG: Tfp pilus assembly protein FimT/FimU [Thiohalomonadales bacterium]